MSFWGNASSRNKFIIPYKNAYHLHPWCLLHLLSGIVLVCPAFFAYSPHLIVIVVVPPWHSLSWRIQCNEDYETAKNTIKKNQEWWIKRVSTIYWTYSHHRLIITTLSIGRLERYSKLQNITFFFFKLLHYKEWISHSPCNKEESNTGYYIEGRYTAKIAFDNCTKSRRCY